MTREEVKKILWERKYITDRASNVYGRIDYVKIDELESLVDKIFDDFEKMNCKNCKHLDDFFICWNERSPWFDTRVCEWDEDPSVLCCKFFERKE